MKNKREEILTHKVSPLLDNLKYVSGGALF